MLQSSLLAALCAVILQAQLSLSALPGLPYMAPNRKPWQNGDACQEWPFTGDNRGWRTIPSTSFGSPGGSTRGDGPYNKASARVSNYGRIVTVNEYLWDSHHIDILDEHMPAGRMDLGEMFITVTFKSDNGDTQKRNYYMPKVPSIFQKKCTAQITGGYYKLIDMVIYVAP